MCGYCAHSIIDVPDPDEPCPHCPDPPLIQEERKLYCLDTLTVEEDETEPKTNEQYGSSCPDTEVLQICINSFGIGFAGTCSDVSPCNGDDYDCYFGTNVVQNFPKHITIPIARDIDNNCSWHNIYYEDIPVGGNQVGASNKVCRRIACCNEEGAHWRNKDVMYSDIITMGFVIYDVELRLTPFCIEDDDYAQQLGHPKGTCGRLVELKVYFKFNDEPNDYPDCADFGDCLSGRQFFEGASCPRLYEGAGETLWDWRGGVQHRGWFFPSCGCMPYCWQDKKCEECGDFFDEDFAESYGCFEREATPVASTDVLGRDRLCNAKDCGCFGCCKGRQGYENECPNCSKGKVGAGGAGEMNCGDDFFYTGFVDECGRGVTYTGGSNVDSATITMLLGASNTFDPNSNEINRCESDDYLGCCGYLTIPMHGNCGAANGNEWGSVYQTFPRTLSREGTPSVLTGTAKGFEMNWRIVPS